jgi:hypothetical protein
MRPARGPLPRRAVKAAQGSEVSRSSAPGSLSGTVPRDR